MSEKRPKNQWISVNDKLPHIWADGDHGLKSDDVLCCLRFKGASGEIYYDFFIGYLIRFGKKKRWRKTVYYNPDAEPNKDHLIARWEEVIYWMPLPPIPENCTIAAPQSVNS